MNLREYPRKKTSFYGSNLYSLMCVCVNDEFSGVGEFFTNYQMWIFDRWGNMIFYTNDIEKRWNGKVGHSNTIAQEDVYIYLVKLFDLQKTEHTYKGTVTLIK